MMRIVRKKWGVRPGGRQAGVVRSTGRRTPWVMWRSAALLAVAIGVSGSPLEAQRPFTGIIEDLREREYHDVRTNLLAAVEKMPASNFDDRVTPGVRSFAEEVIHGAAVNYRLCGLAANDQTPVPPPDVTDKATVQAYFAASIERCDEVLARSDDENALTPTFNRYIIASHLTAMVGHCNHVYGRLTVMMRASGIEPPSVG